MKELIKSGLNKLCPDLLRRFQVMKFTRNRLPEEFVSHLARLTETDLVIDVGANIGLVTECVAKTGARIIAFEPNKTALNELEKVALRYDNIEVLGVAAGTQNSTAKLYLHKDSALTDDDLTQASSLLPGKPNVSSAFYEEVPEINFANYLGSLEQPVEFIKIDIEGYEIRLINHLLDTKALHKVNKIYLETHERKFELLRDSTVELKRRIKCEGLETKFFYDWH